MDDNKTLTQFPTGQLQYRIEFDYLARPFVVVTLINTASPNLNKELVVGNDYVFINAVTLEIKADQTGYDAIRIQRYTSSEPIVNFQNGSVLTATDLTVSELQAIHIAEEGRDYTLEVAQETLEAIKQEGQRVEALVEAINDVSAYGYDPLYGKSFTTGAIIENWTQVLEDNGNWYKWTGDFPHDVAPGTDPSSDSRWKLITSESEWDAVRRAHGNDAVMVYGMKPDYAGVPQYDGNDASRITATDNSAVLKRMIETAPVDKDGTLRLYFPAGHYGFKTPEIYVDPTVRPDVTNILLVGESMDSSILDFIYERSDGTAVMPETATVLLRSKTIPINTVDIYLKCTTKRGVVRGSTSPDPTNPDVYNGSVWFMHMQDPYKVRTIRTRVSHANFRGISVDAANLPIYMRTRWLIKDCEGHDNTSTGFWGSFGTSMDIDGGRFYHNGTKGLLGTGYGVAASQYIDNVLVRGGAKFFENYRKGVDRHGGVGSLVVSGAYFADNLLRDIEDNKQYNAQYITDLNDTMVVNSTFILNQNRSWLKEALDAVQAGGGSLSCFKAFVSILDRTISGTIANKQRKISFSGNTIKVMGNVPDGYQGFCAFNLEAPRTEFVNCDIDTSGFRFGDNVKGNVYQSYWASTGAHPNAVVTFRKCNVKTHPGSITHPDSNEASNSVLIQGTAGTTIESYDSTFDLHNFVFYGVTGGGNVTAANALIRKFYDTTIIYRNLRLRTQNQTVTNALLWINGGFGLKGTTGNDVYQNCRIGFGDAKVLAPISTSNGMGAKQQFAVPAAGKAVGATVPILLGLLGSNLHVTLAGTLELNADTYTAGFRYSPWTQTVYKGSNYVAFERVGSQAIQFEGVDTNFVATKMQVRWAVASPGDTGWYNGEMSCADWSSPLIIG